MFDPYGNLIWLVIAGIIIAAIRSRRRYRGTEHKKEDPLVALGKRVTTAEDAIGRLQQRLAQLEAEAGRQPSRETGMVAAAEHASAPAQTATQAADVRPTEVPTEKKELSSLEAVQKQRPKTHPEDRTEPVTAEPAIGKQREIDGFIARTVRTLQGREAATEKTDAVLAEKRRALEKMLLENWTGILGAVVVVAGVTFVGIYTALRLAPFYRFLLMLVVAFAMITTAFVLARHERWRAFAAWLRSAGAAILLFACAASGGLPGLGLQWIEQPLPALLLLLAGIGFNLYLA